MKKTFLEWAHNRKENPLMREIQKLLKARMEYKQKFWEWENIGRFKNEPFPKYER